MSPELKMLVWSVALAFIQMLIAVSGAILQVGLPRLAGNREGLPSMTSWGTAGAAICGRGSERSWKAMVSVMPRRNSVLSGSS